MKFRRHQSSRLNIPPLLRHHFSVMVYDDTVKPEEKRGTGDLMPKKLFIARESPSATLPFIRVQTRSNPVFFPDRVLRPLRPTGYAFDAADEVAVDKLQYSISSSKHVNAPIIIVECGTWISYHLSSISHAVSRRPCWRGRRPNVHIDARYRCLVIRVTQSLG